MAIILKGLINFSTNSDIVTGSIDTNGTVPTFTTQLIPGDLIKLPIDLDIYLTTVKTINNDFQLTLTKPYLGSTGSSDYVPITQNEIKAFLSKKIPEMYREEIPDDEFQTVLNVISSAYLDLLPRIKDMSLLYNVNSVDLSQLPYIGYLFGFQFDENLGLVSTFLQQPILKRNQVQNAVAWQKLKGSIFGIQQYLKTLSIAATIKELWYDSTFRNLLDSKVEILSASELWEKNITSNSTQYFTGNNGITTTAINNLVSTVVSGNLVYTPVVNTSIKVEISQQEITPLTGGCVFTANSQIVNGTLTLFTTELTVGDRIKLNSGTVWYTVQSITSDLQLLVTDVAATNGSGASSRIKQAKIVKTKLKQNGSGTFEYDGLSLIPVNLGKVILKSANKEPFNVSGLGNTLYIRVNGGITQAIPIGGGIGGWQTAGVLINRINNVLSGAIAYGDGEGHILIENQTNNISSTLEIVSGVNSINDRLGFNLGIYNATTSTNYDSTTQYLSIQLLNPTDFSTLAGEINITYDYLNYTAPDSIKEFDYKTGAKSNWFDIELTAINSSFILLPDDVAKLVTKVKTDVKPFHALLRTIRYISGFVDTWEWKVDQSSFFKNWREGYLFTVNPVPSDVLQPGSCPCQCCLLYNNCIQKIYNGTILYNWGAIQTSVLNGTITFTNGSTAVTGITSFFTTELAVGDFIQPLTGLGWYQIANIIDNNNLTLLGNYTEVNFTGSAMKKLTVHFGIFYDLSPCLPYHLLIVYNGYISAYGSSNIPTHYLAGFTTFTNGSNIVNGFSTSFTTQLAAGYYIQDPTYNIWYRITNVLDNVTLQLECVYSEPTVTIASVPALDSSKYTKYFYDYNFIDSGIFQNKMLVYYDGMRYTDKNTGETCIFHYDLGEYPKIIGLHDEEYIIDASNNQMQIIPERVKEITGYSAFFNSDTLVFATQTVRGDLTFTNGSDIVVGGSGAGSNHTFFTVDLNIGDYIKPTNLLGPYVTPYAAYQILAIIDDQHLQLVSNYIDADYIGEAVKIGGGNYLTDLTPGDWIKPSSIGSTWYQIAFIASNDILLLTGNYLGPTVTYAVTDKLITSYTTYNITLTPGLRDADYIANEINYQIGQQSIVDGTLNSATWTNGNYIITAPISTGNFNLASTGDWIRNNSGSTWYQVDYVIDADNIMLKQAFSDPTITETGVYGKTILLSLGIPYGANIGFIRLLARVGIDTTTHSKGAIQLVDILNNAYTVLGFNKLYSKATPCYLLYNPASSSVMQIVSVTGSVTMTNGSSDVTGVGTFFGWELITGDLIKLSTGTNSQWSFIAQFISNTHMVLDGNYNGPTGTETDVKVMRQIYDTRLTGTVSFINGNTAVVGAGSFFLSEVAPGDLIRLPGDLVWGEVSIINNDLSITLTVGYGGSTATSAIGTTRKVSPSLFVLGGQNIEPDSVDMEVTTV